MNIIGTLNGNSYTLAGLFMTKPGVVELLHCLGCKDVGTDIINDVGYSITGKISKGHYLRINILKWGHGVTDAVLMRLKTNHYNVNKFVSAEYLLENNFRIRPFNYEVLYCGNGKDGTVVAVKKQDSDQEHLLITFETLHEHPSVFDLSYKRQGSEI